MPSVKDIDIINISKSEKYDMSEYYLVDIYFSINQKRFEHTDYIDPISNTLLNKIIKNKAYIAGNNRSNLLIELSIKLHITDDDARDLFNLVAQSINLEIKNNQKYREIFTPLIDVIKTALSYGFQLRMITPELHFIRTIRTPRGDIELNICSQSINEVIEELYCYSETGMVSETYTYHQLMKICMWHSDFFISINQLGNGWTIFWHGENALELQSRQVDSLRDLYFAIRDCQQESSYR